MSPSTANGFEIAVIGMVARFPGAADLDAFWANIRNGVESISHFTPEELASSVRRPGLWDHPGYVRSRGILTGVEEFDAPFFGFSPREAELTDPQQRVFLECAWEACEHAGYDPDRYAGRIGVFAGTSSNSYFWSHLHPNWSRLGEVSNLQTLIGNEKDFLTTRVSYKLNLRGPSVTVQTACSTSLVAVHLACQSLLSGDCDIALAGGVCITVPQQTGYLYQEGGIQSPDGHCRSFDARARGTVSGNGVGIVVLKRLSDAIAERDGIQAVIKGSAINNDGGDKVGYTAPRLGGQSRVIRSALALAESDPESIGYVEAHGTATTLGDPIELAALTQAFQAGTARSGFCAVGAVKANVGHLDAAAGVAGLIKALLIVQHGQIPPAVHFETPNPAIDFAATPFYVPTRLTPWPAAARPRRAGVSSFGIGGTNAHVIVEEPPAVPVRAPQPGWHVLPLSARTSTALAQQRIRLAAHLRAHPELDLGDVCFTLQTGRRAWPYRHVEICETVADAVTALESVATRPDQARFQEGHQHPVVFVFPGQGTQQLHRARAIAAQEPVFRRHVEAALTWLAREAGLDLREVLLPAPSAAAEAAAAERLRDTAIAQPALFVLEYALAQLWRSWGVTPQALLGHSLGELVAACVAGVFTVEDALHLVVTRGRLMQAMPAGGMLAVPLGVEELTPCLPDALDLAAINTPAQCVVAGPVEALTAFEESLAARGLIGQRLATAHAFHSRLMAPIVPAWEEAVRAVPRQAPRIPWLSNVTGTWIRTEEATDPRYWGLHLRQPVRFADAVSTLLEEPARIWLELGPGHTLSACARRHPHATAQHTILTTLDPAPAESESHALATALARTWLAGATPTWDTVHTEPRHRVALPTYPFERQRYWIDPPAVEETPRAARIEAETLPLAKDPDVSRWFWSRRWERSPAPASMTPQASATCVFFGARDRLSLKWRAALRAKGQRVIQVVPGPAFAEVDAATYAVDPSDRGSYDALAAVLRRLQTGPLHIVHAWTLTSSKWREGAFDAAQQTGFYSVLWLTQSLMRQGLTHGLQIDILTNGVANVSGEERLFATKATLLGACRVIPQELPGVGCRVIDIGHAPASVAGRARFLDPLIAEILNSRQDPLIAYRNGQRWTSPCARLELSAASPQTVGLREGGIYLLVGGTGRIALALTQHLTQTVRAKVVLVSRGDTSARTTHDGDTGRQARKEAAAALIARLQADGAEILVREGNVADRDRMEAIFAEIEERFGRIDGVVHLAGLDGDRLRTPLADLTEHVCRAHFEPKVAGTAVLAQLIARRPIDWCVSFSSLSTVLGGLGFCAYSAANHAMSASADIHNQRERTRWINVQWDGWHFETGRVSLAAADDLAIAPDEGVEAFSRIVAGQVDEVIVSTADLQRRLDAWTTPRTPAASRGPAAPSPRPDDAPGDESADDPLVKTERLIAAIWGQVLGSKSVGPDDNFFELGGDSLLGLQVVARMRETFQVDVPTTVIYESPTTGELAKAVERRLVEAISQMSDEEIVRAMV